MNSMTMALNSLRFGYLKLSDGSDGWVKQYKDFTLCVVLSPYKDTVGRLTIGERIINISIQNEYWLMQFDKANEPKITSDKKIIPSIRNINFNQSDNNPSN